MLESHTSGIKPTKSSRAKGQQFCISTVVLEKVALLAREATHKRYMPLCASIGTAHTAHALDYAAEVSVGATDLQSLPEADRTM